MSGYKSGYSEEHSPYYAAGVEDAQRDAMLVSTCPPSPPVGPDLDKTYSTMYLRGYESVPQMPHIHDKSCQKDAA